MQVIDWIILGINVICVIFSIVGALQSYTNYKKCMQLTNYANLRAALDECQSIQNIINHKLLRFCSKDLNSNRGVNTKREITECGEYIENSLSKIKELLPSNYHKKVVELLACSQDDQFNIEVYVVSLISGSAFGDQKVTEDNVYKMQKNIEAVQLYIKEIIESIQDREKKM